MAGSTTRPIVATAILTLLSAAPGGTQDRPPEPDVVFPAGRPSVEVSATVFNNVVYLPVSVNGGEPLAFALDTGAPELSAVELTHASELGLTAGPAMTVRGAESRRLDVRRLEGASLSVGGVTARNLEVVAMPLNRLEPFWGHPMDGILGGNFLNRVVTCIDYDRQRVTFVRSDAFNPDAHGSAVPIEVEDNTLFITAQVSAGDGRPAGPGRFLVDTGVRQTFLNSPFVARHRLLERSGPVIETVTGYGISGPAFGALGRLGALSLGPHTLAEPIVQLCSGTSGIESSRVFDGIIGADLLSRFSVCIDYSGRTMYLDPGTGMSDPFPANAGGLVFRVSKDDPGSFTVAHVVEGSPADRAGIRIGDTVVAANGRPSAALTLEDLIEAQRQTGECCVDLRRNGETREICFELQPSI
ncbi:MAG: aspartyl protease family protein [Candidatus Sulfomarinibacteraceae bacterium]